MILARWVSTVLVLIASAAAISLLSLPASHEGEYLTLAGREKLGVFELILDRMRSGQVQQHGGSLKRARQDACGSKICKTGGVRASLLACLLHNRGALESNRYSSPSIRLRPFFVGRKMQPTRRV
jgi:hypothetical protein